MATLRLDPENAALSVARRVETIVQCMAYIRATVARYDGLKAFDAELKKLKVADQVVQICAAAPAQE